MTDSADALRDSMRSSTRVRTERTRRAIIDALADLAADAENSASAEELTVIRIVRSAGISRSAFYTHFSGIDELATTILDEALTEIGAQDHALRMAGELSGRDIVRASTRALLEHVVSRRSLYASVFAQPGAHGRLIDEIADVLMGSATFATNAPDPNAVAITARYLGAGTVEVLGDWLSGRLAVSEEELIEYLSERVPAWLD